MGVASDIYIDDLCILSLTEILRQPLHAVSNCFADVLKNTEVGEWFGWIDLVVVGLATSLTI